MWKVRILLRVLGLLLLVLLILSGSTAGYIRYVLPGQSFPQTTGAIRLPGLKAPVEVVRDSWGVPHIYASTPDDLFMAQGYVQAQDRLWQMDLWRHTSGGRLSELFGENTLNADRLVRTLGFERTTQQELGGLQPEERAVLEAYARGVNAYVDGNRAHLGMEFSIINSLLLRANYTPEPWKPLHTLSWAKSMAWLVNAHNLQDEMLRSELLATAGPGEVEMRYPAYPTSRPIIVPSEASEHAGGLDRLTQAIQDQAIRVGLITGRGSNAWVVSGSRTMSGKPLLANDPHLDLQIPSIWYENGLHCQPRSDGCPYDVVGFSFAGVPGVIIGHNQRIAWGITDALLDTMDLYHEKVNPDNPNQVEYQGKWEDMQVVREEIRVKGRAEPVILDVRMTRHGPLINDLVRRLGQPSALQWTALRPSHLFRAVLNINKADNWDEFRAALRDWRDPAQNFVYGDVDGHIGYYLAGYIPLRTHSDGLAPSPGWTGENEWSGEIPFEQLPQSFDPSQGFLVSANNLQVGPDYPFPLPARPDAGYRAQRIGQLLQAKERLTIEDMTAIQGDNRNLAAEDIVPYFKDIHSPDRQVEQALDIMRAWDFENRRDRAGAMIFEAILIHLQQAMWGEELGSDLSRRLLTTESQGRQAVSNLLAQPHSTWWTDRKKTRDDILLDAATAAIHELGQRLGDDPGSWTWGQVHTTTFRNQSLGRSGMPLLEALFNRGPVETDGGASIVNATSQTIASRHAVSYGPSMRMIVDLGDLSNSKAINTTGQSGHPYHKHYDDMIAAWQNLQYHPMLWERAAVEQDMEGKFTLTP